MINNDNRPAQNKRLLRNHDTLVQWIQHFMNMVLVCISLSVLAYIEEGEVKSQYRIMLAFAVLLITIVYHMVGVFQ